MNLFSRNLIIWWLSWEEQTVPFSWGTKYFSWREIFKK